MWTLRLPSTGQTTARRNAQRAAIECGIRRRQREDVERYFQPWKQYGLGSVNRLYQAVLPWEVTVVFGLPVSFSHPARICLGRTVSAARATAWRSARRRSRYPTASPSPSADCG